MSQDNDLRSLVRASAEAPNDRAAREKLEQAWRRAGRGWYGETLPADVEATTERRVYRHTGVFRHGSGIAIEMVYVPGGPQKCTRCKGRGSLDTLWQPDPDRDTWVGFKQVDCPQCGGARTCPGAPFYIGRYPVTNREWEEALEAGELPSYRHGYQESSRAYHPVVSVTLTEAMTFCKWAGVEIPTPAEWTWAAFGGPRCPCRAHDCPNPKDARYPWGNKPATPDRAVNGPTAVVVSQVERDMLDPGALQQFGYDPSKAPMVPARPNGMSWCEAYDMSGNVWEWTDDGDARGGGSGGWSANGLSLVPSAMRPFAPHDHNIGFRVVSRIIPS